MSISTRAYKILCKNYRDVLNHLRLTQACLEAGLPPRHRRSRSAPVPQYGLEALDPRILLSGSPLAPDDLLAHALANVAAPEIDLAWSDPNSGSGDTYNLYRGTTAGAEDYTHPIVTGLTAAVFVDTNVAAGGQYFYTVEAVKAGQSSDASVEFSATTAPDAIAALQATVSGQGSQVQLTWSAPTDASGNPEDVTGYQLYRATVGQTSEQATPVAVTGTTYTDTSVTPGTQYWYFIRAVNAGGSGTPCGMQVDTSCDGDSQMGQQSDGHRRSMDDNNAPTDLGTMSGYAGDGHNFIVVYWNGSGSYDVYRSESPGEQGDLLTPDGDSSGYYWDEDLPDPNCHYWYTVQPPGDAGDSATIEAISGPAAPTDVTCGTSQGGVAIDWSDPNPNDAGGHSTPSGDTYNIYRSTFDPGYNIGGDRIGYGLTSVGDFIDYGPLSPETTYYYTVTAVNEWGLESPPSTAASITWQLSVPGAPTGLSATISATNPSGAINLSWTAPTSGVVGGYNIYCGTSDGGESSTPINEGLITGTTYTDDVSPNTHYYYTVVAINAAGSSSDSNQADALTTPAAPAGVQGTASYTAGQNAISLSWTGSGSGVTYNVYRSTSSGVLGSQINSAGITSCSYADADPALTIETSYYYTVFAINTSGSSSASTQVRVITAPMAPTNLAATPTDGQAGLALSWTAVSPAPGQPAYTYNVYRLNGQNWTPLQSGISGTAYTDTTAAIQTAYSYKVAAVDAHGVVGVLSSEVDAVAGVPASPLITQCQFGSDDNYIVCLRWSDSLNGAGLTYQVYRGTSPGAEDTYLAPNPDDGPYWLDDSPPIGNTVYYYIVKAVDSNGVASLPSNEMSIQSTPFAPREVDASVLSTQPTSAVQISWCDTATGETGTNATDGDTYTIWRKDQSLGSTADLGIVATGLTGCSFIDVNAIPGSSYLYEVEITNAQDATSDDTLTTVITAPVVAVAPTAIDGTQAVLDVYSAAGGFGSYDYHWFLAGAPAAPVAFSAVGPSEQPDYYGETTATFSAPGIYDLMVAVTDTVSGTTTLIDTIGVAVTVNQNASSLSIVPIRQYTAPSGTPPVYQLYGSSAAHGSPWELEFATALDPSDDLVGTSYFRYDSGGNLEYDFDPEAYARLVGACGSNVDSLPDGEVAAYATDAYTYDGQNVASWTQAGAGTATYTYQTNSGGADAGNNVWATKITEQLPGWQDGTNSQDAEVITYENASGQVILQVTQQRPDPTPLASWYTYNGYDTSGNLIMTAGTSAVADYYEETSIEGQIILHVDLNSTGLITNYQYYNANDPGFVQATTTQAGGVDGYYEGSSVQDGQGGTPIAQDTATYIDALWNDDGEHSYMPADITVDPSGIAATTTYAYYVFSPNFDPTLIETITAAAVPTTDNGTGEAAVTTEVYNAAGQLTWERDANGSLSYFAYDPATGALVEAIQDVDTSLLSGAALASFQQATTDATQANAPWSEPTGTLNLVTTYVVDAYGRATQETDPDGNVTYWFYDDGDREVRTYTGWNSSTDTTTGPVSVTLYDQTGFDGSTPIFYSDTVTFTEAGGLNNDGNGAPTGDDDLSSATIQSLTRDFFNAAGQWTEERQYISFSNLSYTSLIADPGTAYSHSTDASDPGAGNYLDTTYQYDPSRGWWVGTTDPDGDIDQSDYDVLGRVVSTWVGTTSDPTALTETNSYIYDNGGAGDGNLTQSTQYVNDGNSADDCVTDYLYDWRDRLIAYESGVNAAAGSNTHPPITVYALDNLGDIIGTYGFDGDAVSLTTAVTNSGINTTPAGPGSTVTGVVAYSRASYDPLGQVYQTQTFGVTASSGHIASTGLTSQAWYNADGQVIEDRDPTGLTVKYTYDQAGRLTGTYTTDGGAVYNSGALSAPTDLTHDVVVSQTQYVYDPDGNVIQTISADRLSGDLDSQVGVLDTSGGGGPAAFVDYQTDYYDAADRLTATADYGTEGEAVSPPAIGDTPPARSDTILVTSYAYDAAGLLTSITDPKGIVTKMLYDALGRETTVIADYTNGVATSSSNQTTAYTYDGIGNVLTMTAVMPSGTPSQTTEYFYGVTTSDGSDINTNELLAQVAYPDPTTGAANSSSRITYTYDAAGDVLTMTDQNGTVHQYSYDCLGRQTLDAISNFAGGIDSTICAIATAYTALGEVAAVTSYQSTVTGDPTYHPGIGQTQIANQETWAYNALGQVTADHQAHGGAVGATPTTNIGYTYGSASQGSRLATMTYGGSGDYVVYACTTAWGFDLDWYIGRVGEVIEANGGVSETLSYQGLSTIVSQGESDGMTQTLTFDRFGRVSQDLWKNSCGVTTDGYAYTYDRDGNVLTKTNFLNDNLNELYTYDNLGRLTTATEGANPNQNDIPEYWFGIDALGNTQWFITNGNLTAGYTYNSDNQAITYQTTAGTVGLTYDADGNLIVDQSGNHLTYDAWNRLVSVSAPGSPLVGPVQIAAYTYDGVGRQVTQTAYDDGTPVTTTDLYYDEAGQVVEEAQGGVVTTDYIWSLAYVNAMIARISYDPSGNGDVIQLVFPQYDANFNVTSLVDYSDSTPQLTERFLYDPYGTVTVTNAGWTPITGVTAGTDDYAWIYLFQGGRYDINTGNYTFGARDYSPLLQRWTQLDPTGYPDGANAYGFVNDNPTNLVDPTGLDFFNWGNQGPTYPPVPNWFGNGNDLQAAPPSLRHGDPNYDPDNDPYNQGSPAYNRELERRAARERRREDAWRDYWDERRRRSRQRYREHPSGPQGPGTPSPTPQPPPVASSIFYFTKSGSCGPVGARDLWSVLNPPSSGGSPLAGPRPSPNFQPPTNPPQVPPDPLPGYRPRPARGNGTIFGPPGQDPEDNANTLRLMGPAPGFPNGYWVQYNSEGQRIDPSTGNPGSRPETHVPFPPGYYGGEGEGGEPGEGEAPPEIGE